MSARIVRWVVVPLAALALLWLLGRTAGAALPAFLERVQALGPLGPVVYVLTYTAATIALVPGSILTLAAGALFGLASGTLYALLGATCGAAAAFLVSRHLARRQVERRLRGDPRFERLDRAIGREGFKLVLLLRLSPIFPFTLLNYALGLTRVRFRHYLVASIAMLPGTLVYVYYGRVAGDVAAIAAGAPASRPPGYYTYLVLGLVATLLLTALIARLARRALTREEIDGAMAAGG